MSDKMFGVDLCRCDEDLQEREIIDEIVFCSTCKGVISYEPVYDVTLTVTDQGVLSSFTGIAALPPGTYNCRVKDVVFTQEPKQ